MNLICPRCSGQVPDTASSCPHCGLALIPVKEMPHNEQPMQPPAPMPDMPPAPMPTMSMPPVKNEQRAADKQPVPPMAPPPPPPPPPMKKSKKKEPAPKQCPPQNIPVPMPQPPVPQPVQPMPPMPEQDAVTKGVASEQCPPQNIPAPVPQPPVPQPVQPMPPVPEQDAVTRIIAPEQCPPQNIPVQTMPVGMPQMQPQAPRKKSKKAVIIPIVSVASLLVVGLFAFLLYMVLGNTDVKVESVDIGNWKITSEGYSIDFYEATLTSEQKETFVAVVGSRSNLDYSPEWVLMQNGEGAFETYKEKGSSPENDFYVMGYYSIDTIKDEDASVSYSVDDYNDYKYLKETTCNVRVDIELKKAKSGVLIIELENRSTNKTDDIMLAVVDGRGSYSKYVSGLPYMYRGVDVVAHMKGFIEGESLTEADYSVKTPLDISANEFSSEQIEYIGKKTWRINKFDKGYAICNVEVVSGGNPGDEGTVRKQIKYFSGGECTLSTYLYVSPYNPGPLFEMSLISCIPPWKEFA